jgi:hypothetical protein
MNDGALAFSCETKYGVESCLEMVAFFPKKKGTMYYDDLIVRPENGQCISYDGVYRYPIKSGMYKTVPKIKFLESELPNPSYTQEIKLENHK